MLKFDDLDDVGADDAALHELLTGGQPSEDSYLQDPDPEYGKPRLEDRIFPDPDPAPRTAASGKRVTQTIRKDIRGKVAMLLTVAGATWSSRDATCGNALIESIPDSEQDERIGVATALTDLICDSPDVVKWFTTSGRYMKWLTLAMAVQPVLTTVFHHHVTHAITDDESTPDWSGYGAG